MERDQTARGAARAANSQPQRQLEDMAGSDSSSGLEKALPSQAQKPRMKWVYNSDHTDPVNFGFMFLVPDDGSDDVSQKPSLSSTESALVNTSTPSKTYPAASQQPSTTSSTASSIFSPDFVTKGSYLAQLNKSRSVSPEALQQINPNATFFTSPNYLPGNDYQTYYNLSNSPVSHPPSTSSYSAVSPQQLTHRPSPRLASANISPQTLTPNENLSWQSKIIQHAGHWNTNVIPEQAYAPSTFGASPELINASSLLQKRKYARSPSPADDVILSSNTSRRVISKRRRGPQLDLMPVSGYDRVPMICSRCHIYQVANYTAEEMETLLNRTHQSKDPGVCNLCLQEFSLYQWPSAGQSRLENLESLVLFLLPAHMEDALLSGPAFIPRNRSWRGFMLERPHAQYDFDALSVHQDSWAVTVKQARSTLLWGDDANHLIDIVRNYQKSLSKPNVSLQAASTCFNAVCDLYNCFVSSPTRPPTCSVEETIAHVRTVRITLRNAFQHLQHLALSPTPTRDRKDWFPTFLSAVIITMAAITFIDILGSCPSPYKERIWGEDWGERIKEMRHGGYGMLIGVLRANTNGVNPLKLNCWTEEESNPFIIETPKSYEKGKRSTKDPTSPAGKERDVLLGKQSPAALRGMLELKRWQERYQEDLMIGEDMFQKELYAQAMMRPVASLWKVFEMKDTSGL